MKLLLKSLINIFFDTCENKILTSNKFNLARTDYPLYWQKLFQSPATPVAEGIINLHHDVSTLLIIIAFFVVWFLIHIIAKFTGNRFFLTHFVIFDFSLSQQKKRISWIPVLNLKKFERKQISQLFTVNDKIFVHLNPQEKHSHFAITVLEIFWTIIPGLLLVLIALPSFALLYAMEELVDPKVTVKAIGHQWYWSYEIGDPSPGISFDSYMVKDIKDKEILPKRDGIRLLSVDNVLKLPIKTHIRLLVTSTDVIHSWAVPSLGVKVDAVPGRLNEAAIFIKRGSDLNGKKANFYGQCSELCGENHGFMPIHVQGVRRDEYLKWILEKQND